MAEIERDRSINNANVNHKAEQSKLTSSAPPGVRRPSVMPCGKSMFQDAMLATGKYFKAKESVHIAYMEAL